MSERTYLLVSATVFGLIAILHFARLISHWSIQIGATTFPLWGSWIGLFIAIGLSLWAFRLVSQWKTLHQ